MSTPVLLPSTTETADKVSCRLYVFHLILKTLASDFIADAADSLQSILVRPAMSHIAPSFASDLRCV